MSDKDIPEQSTATLIKASVIAIVLAVIAMVMVVLPAEYGVDPTGFGRVSGLSALSVGEQSNAVLPATDSTLSAPDGGLNTSDNMFREDEAAIWVPAQSGLEYKFYLEAHQNLTYEWYTDGAALYFDLHGEPAGDSKGYFESFAIADAVKMKGTVLTPFAGSHGWYFKNNTDANILVTLKTSGSYQVLGLK